MKIDPRAPSRFSELSQYFVDPGSIRLLPSEFCYQHNVVVLGAVDRNSNAAITIGMLNERDTALAARVSNVLSRPVTPVRLNIHEIHRALDRGHGFSTPDVDRIGLSLKETAAVSNDKDSSTVRIIDEILGRALTLGASDVHIESYEDDADVRVRIDGALHQIQSPLDPKNVKEAISRLKVLASLDIAENFVAQDGRIYGTYQARGEDPRPVDFRISIVPGPFGPDAVLRILDSRTQLWPLPMLGVSEGVLKDLTTIASSADGLVLVTGPTGSGKTTTLYSILNLLNDMSSKIMTVEDPIEYRFAKIIQKQTTTKMGFADYARSFLRQDPDIIMIGEIRDEETAEVAMKAAQTGHLVLSTLHTNDAVSTVSRLLTLGVEPEMLSSCLLGVLAQRLVRTICTACKVTSPLTIADEPLLARVEGASSQHGAGCPRCLDTGFKGRIGLFELFMNHADYSPLITRKMRVAELRNLARERGMLTLLEDGLAKVAAGLTTPSELRRTISYRLIEEGVRS